MPLFLDTNAWLWWMEGSPRLGIAARERIADNDALLFVSAAAIWEIAIKRSLGKLRLAISTSELVRISTEVERIEVMSIETPHVLAVEAMPQHHRDPFDRILVAQAQAAGLPIVTSDRAIARYDVDVIDATA